MLKHILVPRFGTRRLWSAWLFFFLTFCLPIAASAADDQAGGPNPLVQLRAPLQNQVTINTKPKIDAVFKKPIALQTLFIMLDGIDITQLAVVDGQGFAYTPIQVLAPGNHTLTISGETEQGQSFTQEFGFATRHYQNLEMGYSENELTLVGQGKLTKSESMEGQVPDEKIEVNLRSTSKIQEKGFDLSFNTNVRYLYQDIEPIAPEKTGTSLIDFLLSTNYTQGGVTTHGELGDTDIVLSENTLPSLRRRGVQLSVGSNTAAVGGFTANSAQTYAYDGELGLGNDPLKRIYGWYGDLNLMDNRLRLRLLHTAGGESGSSFGTYTQETDKEGQVSGVVLTTDFFEGKLVTEFEYDRAEFDNDTTDGQDAEEDTAYRLQFQGGVDRYSYGLAYKYIGPQYEVVGNQGLEKDRAGIALNGGASFDRHAVSLTYSRYQDNVEDDETLPVLVTHTGGVDYAYLGFEKVSLNLAYQKEVAESSDEPVLTAPTDRTTDTFSSGIAYAVDAWSFGFQGTYALTDDRTDMDTDCENLTLALLPQYFSEALSVSPNLTFNQTKDLAADITTDSYTLGLDVQGRLFKEKFSYGLGGTLDFTRTNDDSVDQQTTVYYVNLDYRIGERIWGYLSPVVGLRGESSEIEDKIFDQTTRDYVFMLVFSTTALFSF